MSTMTRREAVRAMAAAGLAAGALAPFVRGANKSGLDPIILGSGEHRYECIHDWARLPRDLAFGNTHGVCEDSGGNIYVKHTVHATSTRPDAIAVFDAEGTFVRSWGAEYRGGAHGLHYSKEPGGEYLYLCDQARGVVDKVTLTGQKVWTRACPMESGLYNAPGEYHPTNVAVVPWNVADPLLHRAGEVFIADGYGKSWVHHYNARGEYLRSWGGPGKERGQLSCPHGLMVDARDPAHPLLVIADRSNRRLQVFTLDGVHVAFVTDEMRLPCHFDTRGGVLLVPDLMARVTLLDRSSRLIAHLGDDTDHRLRDKPRDQFIPGKFIAPHSACFDHSGNIFVVEWVEVGRVTKLRRV
jgi:hypothetical protein